MKRKKESMETSNAYVKRMTSHDILMTLCDDVIKKFRMSGRTYETWLILMEKRFSKLHISVMLKFVNCEFSFFPAQLRNRLGHFSR